MYIYIYIYVRMHIYIYIYIYMYICTRIYLPLQHLREVGLPARGQADLTNSVRIIAIAMFVN